MASRLDVDGYCEAPVKETDALEMGRRNASTWACRLPPEIWIIIADLMTVKGIEALNFVSLVWGERSAPGDLKLS
jgi:hypothetical protein